MNKKINFYKYVAYGTLGLTLEVFYTGFLSLLRNDFTLEGTSYIWMFFIYGLAVLAEPIHDRIRGKNFIIRGFIYIILIYTIEFIAGSVLMYTVGKCPWDYTGLGINSIKSIISIEFIPVWFILGLILERVHDFLDRIMVSVN